MPLSKETRNKIGTALRGKPKSLEHREKLSRALKGRCVGYKFPKGNMPWNKGLLVLNSMPRTPEWKTKISRGLVRAYDKGLVSYFKTHGKDESLIRKRIKGWRLKPNKPENQLIGILERYYPDFKYNGDFSLGITLGGMIPDFINVNGKKEVIELFGEYWHRETTRWKGTELGRIMAYNSLGFKCLIIWEHELKDEQAVIAKVKRFMKRRS